MNETSQIKTDKSASKDPAKGKKRDRSASERSLLKAAEEVFSKHGFKGATTRMIAKKAGVNESLIGRYFEGKMGLLVAIIERYVLEEDVHTKLTYPPQETLEAELLGFAKFKYELDCKKNFDFFKIVLSQAIVDAKFAKRIRETIPMFFQPQLEERLTNLQKNGKIHKEVDVKNLIKGLDIFMFGNIISQRLLAGVSDLETYKTLEEFIKRYCRTCDRA
ncbi:MAG: TetR/AcrR family transcriptional regulator [Bdellovibrionales bacterium]|nr:TetR/AcrR family transcriptional regulator [Bdellovibrionales bacterium]